MRWQHVLVDDIPVRVENGARFEDVLEELDLPQDRVGIYTDGDGEQKVLPPRAAVTGHVPRNAAITVEQRVTVERSDENDLFSPLQKPATEDTEHTGGGDEPTNTTVYVMGNPVTIGEETTAAEVKEMMDGNDDEVLTFRDDEQLIAISDDKPVLDYADPGTKFELQPMPGSSGVFGGVAVPDPS